ncbi:hypothetical protein GJ744_011158 [Endocarpon pusillum]|uniref:Uncharacterized protein n=1 Tax=Endocarpon pusillum TaxID=364733 RepID=A0A8H7AH50_9EURO|nr:hypothetical protein GJ744_011158 [Endocarpon pusillum]
MLLVVFILAVSYVSTVAAQQSSNTTSTITPGSNQTCQTDFSADLYGLGVRLGYYFNWASGWTANNFVPDEIAGAQDSNSIFLLGVLASLLRGTMTGRLTRLDGLVLLELAAGTVWSVLSLWGYRTCVFKRERLHGISFLGGFGTHFRLLLSTMMASYGLWFFVVGVAAHNDNHLKLASDIGQSPAHCRQILVLGVRLETVRPVGIVLCLISLAYCGIMLVTSSVAGITRLWKMGWLMRHSHYSSSSRLRYISGLGQQQ